MHDFGNLFHVYTIFTTASGLELDPELTKKFAQEPASWLEYYNKKNQSIKESENDQLLEEGAKEYAQAQQHLKTFQNDGNITVLSEVASKMMWILDVFPGHAGCYYVLAFILFILNQLEESILLLTMGRAVDPAFEPIDELENEILRILDGYRGSGDDNATEAALIQGDGLSQPLVGVLEEIFKKFDEDNDGALNSKELDQFIFTTNGSHPPPPFLRQMGLRFGANAKGWLTKDGFLAFYLEQTLDDPSETRNDLTVHGYDGQTLKKLMEE
ncbi:hypothetical protein DFQ28_004665 [Apophysomyces sp. BC1034]|nr:hypothetical protein DFQ29_000085 [Apophysomyces sp. BC1021]KAG0193545.1 hypothetical protein DFQ28_004665 [Apophysomyces sp. BC1034]